MLHGADNATTSEPPPLDSQDIAVEDSISVDNIGLSPYLKLQQPVKSQHSSNGKNEPPIHDKYAEDAVKNVDLKSTSNNEIKETDAAVATDVEGIKIKRRNR